MDHSAPRGIEAPLHWNSASIFIYGGLALLLGIVTVALLKLSVNRSNRDIRAADNAQTAKQGGDDSGSGGGGGGGGRRPPCGGDSCDHGR
ncbi:hypothetical protein NL676_003485 [Syzygium grande]|nr:hypothetical protein NL676_003485 [Syzygium grande]